VLKGKTGKRREGWSEKVEAKGKEMIVEEG